MTDQRPIASSFDRPIVQLRDVDRLSQGAGRVVYRHPERSDLVIKIHKPLKVKPLQRLRTALRYHRRRFGSLLNSFVEIDEFAAIVARNGKVPPFAAQFMGFVQTNLGPGAMFEAMVRSNGKLALNLQSHARSKAVEQGIVSAIDKLWDQIVESGAVVADPSLRNVVVTGDATSGYRLILVDGLGERTLIPILRLSKRAHQAYCARARRTMQKEYRAQAQRP
ncbi:YrbL family protein [Yoonia sediminilitoris]|uniref:PhoP regulatory network protein YrbL n=1 Tax=Yoonia sediminilitoris TaxID=1286148 RepID=A0A2T6KJZ7_9RHOB|nr:YrbL family protein [Yoonia sediminilitoris]PUB16276.1 PhoP regulatory network protein YrbL [Yoonia sediminilitoris]RCW96625.1 PhoP regulatory network protein YrbL [Yoonia sediminilitoris]